ncbi:unnamed protein product [Adineta steineri]|uniref:Uncharacterized protein n=1 Tax=Adineta steineri TaxID=433720 RepID=A0A814YF88_9BILA|nr:unnamed protein product [Adineta steineri]CAF3982867.1 unnamed protein product [Adineta steineri]
MNNIHETVNPITNACSIIASKPSISNKKRQRVGSVIKEFGLNTSAHGFPGIARSQTIHNRVFWTVSLLIFLGVMIYFVTESIIAYFQYSTQTSVTVVVEYPQAFPAVTVCNYSPLRYDRFISPFLNYTNARNLTNTTNTTNFTMEQASYIQEFLIYKLNQNESLNDYFYSLDSMMVSCNYNNMPCTTTNFTWFISPLYGLCYTFNALLKSTGQAGLHYNGDNGGNVLLELSFYVHRKQYVPYVSNGFGMVALVHDNVQMPIIEMTSMLLGPGKHHKLGYAKKTNLFLPAPYTSCNDKINFGMQAMFNQYDDADYGYTQLPCSFACMQAYTYKKCGCGNPFRWSGRTIVLPNTDTPINIELCDIENPCYGVAAIEMMSMQIIWNTYCSDCTLECTYSEFIIQSTSLSAPPPYMIDNIKQFVESSQVPLPEDWNTSYVSEIESNFISFEVAFETTRTEIYSQQPTMAPVDVISNVGGQTGLWIGISFLSLMEIAEMIYRLLRSQCHRFWAST